jgi:uncharacterized caspase-like protein
LIAAEKKIALILANASYSAFGELKNPINDADIVARSLRRAGFEVRNKTNLTDVQTRAALREFSKESKRFDLALVYYAGHGVQIAGKNYVLPIDLTLPETEQDVRLSAVSVDDILDVVHSKYKVVVLDACRDNPVLNRSLTRGRSGAFRQGLAAATPITTDSGGIFIAFSTQADAVASDGDGKYSPFAEAFSKHINVDGSIDDMFSLVTRDVISATRGAQRPFKYASLDTRLCLGSPCKNDAPATAAPDMYTGAKALTQTPPLSDTTRQDEQTASDLFQSLKTGNSDERRNSRNQLRSRSFGASSRFIPYGIPASNSGTIFSFDPRSITYKERGLDVVVGGAPYVTDLSAVRYDSFTEYFVDCSKRNLKTNRINVAGTWSKPIATETPIDLPRGSMGSNLVLLTCNEPENLTPIWSLNSLKTSYVGDFGEDDQKFNVLVYEDIKYANELDAREKFILTKLVRSKAGERGEMSELRWTGIRCNDNTFALTGGWILDAEQSPIYVVGEERNWTPILEGSLVKNLYLLLCRSAN